MTKIPYKEWVEALRSGDYKQTKRTLKGELPDGGTGYCCLGVLAGIMGHGVEKQGLIEGSISEYPDEGPSDIYDDFRKIIGSNYVDDLVYHNDEAGRDFKEIADYIEKGMSGD